MALAVEIDFEELKQVIGRCDKLPTSSPQSAVDVFHADPDLWGAVIRLLRLLDTPQHAAALTPLIRQEILYRLLAGPSGSRLLEISRQDSPSNRIARALTWLQKQFTKGFMVDDLARRVGMSPSSFHQHFKAITGMTPIQYQRRIRLHEARKLLLVDSLGIGRRAIASVIRAHRSSRRIIASVSADCQRTISWRMRPKGLLFRAIRRKCLCPNKPSRLVSIATVPVVSPATMATQLGREFGYASLWPAPRNAFRQESGMAVIRQLARGMADPTGWKSDSACYQ